MDIYYKNYNMKKLIISTVGTSLITNPASKPEVDLLYKNSNFNELECPDEIKALIDKLFSDIVSKLDNLDNHSIRRMSAELNGIYGIYNEELQNNELDIHYLISTDTYQGFKSAEVIKDYLQKKGFAADIYSPQNLSTKSKESFSAGVKELLKWCDENLQSYKNNGFQIIFNLTGGFKSLQGVMNTIAMFYADKITYIFESPLVELIEIPRLPIILDQSPFDQYKTQLLLLQNNKEYDLTEFSSFPEALIDVIDNKVMLSVWGELIWNQIKYNLYDKLPNLPFISYEPDFTNKFHNEVDKKKKFNLLETIAKVAVILEDNQGNPKELNRGGIQYSPLESKSYKGQPLYHFRSNLGTRINCISQNKKLVLTEFGTHDQTQK